MSAIVMGQHYNVKMYVWLDSVLILPIVISGKIDVKCFVGIDLIIQKKELHLVNRLDIMTLNKKLAN